MSNPSKSDTANIGLDWDKITPGVVDRILVDKAIAVFSLIFACNILGPIGVPETFLTVVRYVLAVYLIARLAERFKATLRTLQSDLFLVMLNVLVFASFAWSIQPNITILFLRGEYIQSVLIAIFLATRFTLQQQIRLLCVALAFGAIISALYIGIVPAVGIHQDAVHFGAWRGVFSHKNYFSSVMTLGVATFLIQVMNPQERRPWHWWGLSICLSLILFSTSKTGQVLLVSIFLVLFFYGRYRWRGTKTVLWLYLAAFIAALGIAVLLSAWDQIFIGIGRDPTLSGRTVIWEILRDNYIPRRPLLGYGRGAFWTAGIFDGIGFMPTHAHNGWYDLILDVGMVGFCFYLLSAIQAWYRVLRLAYATNYSIHLWPLAFFTIMFINNYTESLMIYLINILWVLYMTTCWSLKESLMAQQGYPLRSSAAIE